MAKFRAHNSYDCGYLTLLPVPAKTHKVFFITD